MKEKSTIGFLFFIYPIHLYLIIDESYSMFPTKFSFNSACLFIKKQNIHPILRKCENSFLPLSLVFRVLNYNFITMNRFIRKSILPFLFLGFLIAGCTSTPTQVSNPSDDATIKYLYIVANDSSPNASSASFTIENEGETGLIYNVDSLPYGTRIDSLYLQITFGSSLGYIINDTISESNYLSTATTQNHIDFTKPVKIKNLATNGSTVKEYNIEVRVHKVETYLHTWTQLTSAITPTATENQKAVLLNDDQFLYYQNDGATNSLYTSADATNWQKQSAPQGLPTNPKLRNLLIFKNKVYLLHNGNELYHSADGKTWEHNTINGDPDYNYTALLFGFKDRLWAVAQHKTNNGVRTAYSNDGINWTFGGKRTFYNNFPVSDFGATNFQPNIGPDKVIVIGGFSASGERLNTLWAAENIQGADSLKWLNLNNTGRNIVEVSHASVENYGNKLLLFSGLQADTIPHIQLRHSINEGMQWVTPDTLVNRVPKEYIYRSGTSLVHDTKNRTLYVIGGKSAISPLSDVWKIKVNFYSFDDYDPLNSKY